MIDADTLADWWAVAKWSGKTLKDVVDMKYGERSKLVEGMWNLEDSDIRVEDAFRELVEKRVEVMMELTLSSKKELTDTLFLLIQLEGIELSQVERDELINVKEKQKQENKTAVEQQSKARQEVEEKMKNEKMKKLVLARGEITPPNSPIKEKKSGSVGRSPGAMARNRARLLDFQLKCEEERGLPASRLQEEIRREEKTPSPGSSPRLKPVRCGRGEVVGRDLREEFERLGAEAQHLPLAYPPVGIKEEEEQEDDYTWYGEGSCGLTTNPTFQKLACRKHIHVQRLSECVGSGEGAEVSTTSLVWWYQPDGWAPNYWASLVFYCCGCQEGKC